MSSSFLDAASKLTRLPRAGYALRGVANPESVADHIYRVAVMALYHWKAVEALGGSLPRLIRICLCHDIGEAVIGDIVPEQHQSGDQKISKQKKQEMEMAAVTELSLTYDFPELMDCFFDYEEGKSIEAVIAKDLDVLEMLDQALEYLITEPQLDRLAEYMFNNKQRIVLPVFAHIADDLDKMQQNFLTGKPFEPFESGEVLQFYHDINKLKLMKDPDTGISIASQTFMDALSVLYKGQGQDDTDNALRATLLAPLLLLTDMDVSKL